MIHGGEDRCSASNTGFTHTVERYVRSRKCCAVDTVAKEDNREVWSETSGAVTRFETRIYVETD